MEDHEMKKNFEEAADILVSELSDQVQEQYEDLPKASANGYARLDAGLLVIFPNSEDASQRTLVRSLIMDSLVKKGVEWAVDYRKMVTEAMYRPAYDSAIEAGVEPAVVIAANCKVTLKEARAVVRAIRKEENRVSPESSTVEERQDSGDPHSESTGDFEEN